MSENLSILSDLLGSRKSVDETIPDRPVFNGIDPKLIQAQPAASETNSQPLRAEVRTEIRDDILVEDLAPRPTEPIDEPPRSRDRNVEQAIALLEHYSFDIEGGSARGFVTYWAEDLPSAWLRLAVLEALYQGRYKAVSVSQILALWERKQQPHTHFNEEFEQLICDRLFAEVEAEVEAEAVANESAIPADEAETPAANAADLTGDVIRLPEIPSPSDEAIAPQSPPEHTAESAESAESIDPDASDLHFQRTHPTHIAQFVPEGESHIYDKLRDLAQADEPEDGSAPSAPPIP
jgi:hypothetical protein